MWKVKSLPPGDTLVNIPYNKPIPKASHHLSINPTHHQIPYLHPLPNSITHMPASQQRWISAFCLACITIERFTLFARARILCDISLMNFLRAQAQFFTGLRLWVRCSRGEPVWPVARRQTTPTPPTAIETHTHTHTRRFFPFSRQIRAGGLFVYVQIYRNLRRNPKSAFEKFFSSTPSGPGFSHCL